MSFLVADTGLVSGAADDLARLGSTISEVNSAVAARTTTLASAGADEVSAAIAAVFGAHGQSYQALSAQVEAFHDQFVQNLFGGAQAYTAAEAANTNPLKPLFDAINAPSRALFNRPLIGNGNNGTAPGQNGEDGGIFFGNGGNGAANTGGGNTGGKGGDAGLFGSGGLGGAGSAGAHGGAGGNGGFLWGNGAAGGAGPSGGGAGGRAWLIGTGGAGGDSLSFGGGGNGGAGGFLVGDGGAGGGGGTTSNGGLGGQAGLVGNGGDGGNGGTVTGTGGNGGNALLVGNGGNGGTPGGTGGQRGILFGMNGKNG
jgi:PE family